MVSSRSLATIGEKKQNKIDYMSIAEDLEKSRSHLTAEISTLSAEIEQPQSHHGTWLNLAKVTLARIIMFNKRRSGEIATLE
jgi:phage regulator Rha-like protein